MEYLILSESHDQHVILKECIFLWIWCYVVFWKREVGSPRWAIGNASIISSMLTSKSLKDQVLFIQLLFSSFPIDCIENLFIDHVLTHLSNWEISPNLFNEIIRDNNNSLKMEDALHSRRNCLQVPQLKFNSRNVSPTETFPFKNSSSHIVIIKK